MLTSQGKPSVEITTLLGAGTGLRLGKSSQVQRNFHVPVLSYSNSRDFHMNFSAREVG